MISTSGRRSKTLREFDGERYQKFSFSTDNGDWIFNEIVGKGLKVLDMALTKSGQKHVSGGSNDLQLLVVQLMLLIQLFCKLQAFSGLMIGIAIDIIASSGEGKDKAFFDLVILHNFRHSQA
ncbi:hypothetical protein MKW98_008085 [Papaver atlanticum]|uniref:Uncharacterized protein n=1 Tax=Papaver atlanticum TaxID=357466 RepID=A0AAD4S8N4_9MAGN|nr:hypothetical protein MKW98_008085 [Papaver atlanticum]